MFKAALVLLFPSWERSLVFSAGEQFNCNISVDGILVNNKKGGILIHTTQRTLKQIKITLKKRKSQKITPQFHLQDILEMMKLWKWVMSFAAGVTR